MTGGGPRNRRKGRASAGEFYFERNRWMVERADLLVAFWNGAMRGSGTANTIRLADARGIPVIWFKMV